MPRVPHDRRREVDHTACRSGRPRAGGARGAGPPAGETWAWDRDRATWAVVLEQAGTPLGFAAGGGLHGEGFLEHLWVRPEARTFATARRLWSATMAELARQGYRRPVVCTEPGARRLSRLLLVAAHARCYALREGYAWWVTPTVV